MEAGRDSPLWHGALPSGPGGNPVCEIAQFWVVHCAFPMQEILSIGDGGCHGRVGHLTHLPGTGQASRGHCIKCKEPD